MSDSVQISVGDINERGYLNGMTRRGFTPAKGNLELAANTLDSHDAAALQGQRTLLYNVQQHTVELIDDAGGMNEQDIRNAFSMHRENHTSDASRGVSGMGGKNSMCILSQKKNMRLYTRKRDNTFYRIEVPWTDIFSEGLYTGKVQLYPMDDTEKEAFIKQRYLNGMCHGQNVHGTSIEFPSNDELVEVIEENFKPIAESEVKNPLDRMAIVFGRETMKFAYRHHENPDVKVLEKYNYFSLPTTEYYRGISSYTIEQWTKGEDHRYLLNIDEGVTYEINKVGRGFKKEPERTVDNTQQYQHVGNYTVQVGLRSDSEYFTSTAVALPENTREIYGLDKKFLGDDTFDYLAQYKLFRNNMLIGLIPSPDVAISSHRANSKADLEYRRVQVEVSFCPVSLQGNAMDRAMNIQENKNQFDGKSISLKFTRLLKWLRQVKANEIWTYFTTAIARPPAPVPLVEEEESDDEDATGPPPTDVLNQLYLARTEPLPESDTDTESIASEISHHTVTPPPCGLGSTPHPPLPNPHATTQITMNLIILNEVHNDFMEHLRELCGDYQVTIT
jgi:hypothetical protein